MRETFNIFYVCLNKYLLSSKYLLPDEVARALLIVDFVLIRHVLVELSNSNDLQLKEASDRQAEAQVSGSLLDNSLLSLPGT